MTNTINDWLWRPDRLPESRALVPYSPMPAPAAELLAPRLNLDDLDAGFQLAVQALSVLLVSSGVVGSSALYDPRLELIRAYFIAGSRGELSLPDLAVAARDEVLGMGDDPVAAILGFELAKAGFLAMGLPRLAAPFGRQAARGRQYLRKCSLDQQTRFEEETSVTQFNWR